MGDKFKGRITEIDQPARNGFAVTPSDSADLAEVSRNVYVGTQGDLTVIMADDKTNTPLTIPSVIGYNPIQVKRIMDTNTDAAGIVVFY